MNFYRKLLDHLNEKRPFKFSRFGDGEWNCIMGHRGHNRDGNYYYPELGDALKKIVMSQPDYYMGMQPGVLALEPLKDEVYPMIWGLNIDWVNADILHRASEYGYLQSFIDALRGRNNILVGAEYFTKIDFIPYVDRVVLPESNSFMVNHETIPFINETASYYDDPVVLVMAAMNSNVIIDKIETRNNTPFTAIDIGSVFDPYLGIRRAGYQGKVLGRVFS